MPVASCHDVFNWSKSAYQLQKICIWLKHHHHHGYYHNVRFKWIIGSGHINTHTPQRSILCSALLTLSSQLPFMNRILFYEKEKCSCETMDKWSLKSFYSFNFFSVFIATTAMDGGQRLYYYCSWIFLFEIYVFYFLIFFHNNFSMMFSYLMLFIFLKLSVQKRKTKWENAMNFLHQIVVMSFACLLWALISLYFGNSLINKCKNE